MRAIRWIWAIVCVGLCIYAGVLVYLGTFYNDNTVNLTTSSRLLIEIESSKPVIAEAVSSQYFLLWNKESGDSIKGLLAEKPLGWTYPQYYRAEPKNITPGQWTILSGNSIYIKLTSPGFIKVRHVMNETMSRIADFIIVALAFVLWRIGVFIMRQFEKGKNNQIEEDTGPVSFK